MHQGRLFADILRVGLPTALNAVMVNLTVILVTALYALVCSRVLSPGSGARLVSATSTGGRNPTACNSQAVTAEYRQFARLPPMSGTNGHLSMIRQTGC
ncbi:MULTISPECIES: hypothetical protein [unclassified Bradyrhizobium]|uniref:hypothetical protein n=1 Tax=unclassified Bradyrhizobium TaxID=2631580 RepID=UPI0028E544CB|nr:MULTISPECIES: hypothetical protein [unclassified Bradyrhizobium]